jgi:hypothetical protein
LRVALLVTGNCSVELDDQLVSCLLLLLLLLPSKLIRRTTKLSQHSSSVDCSHLTLLQDRSEVRQRRGWHPPPPSPHYETKALLVIETCKPTVCSFCRLIYSKPNYSCAYPQVKCHCREFSYKLMSVSVYESFLNSELSHDNA